MSKVMDALEYIKQRIAWCPEHEKCPSCRDTESNLAALRDYITTTEAERAASDELEPGDPIASGCCPSCGIHIDVLAGEDEGEVVAVGTNDAGFSRESYWIDHGALPAKAARIKELEEAIRGVLEDDDSSVPLATQRGNWDKRMTACRNALKGARGE